MLLWPDPRSQVSMGQLIKSQGKSIEGTGVVGTITVSGLPQEDDHKVVVQALKQYLEEN
jgi:uncharacterized protein (UPF0303 family)